MSKGFYQYLQKQYGNVVASGRGQCVFVSADDESAFRQTADEFVSDASRPEFMEKLCLEHLRTDGEDYSFTYERVSQDSITYLQARVAFVC